MPQSTVGHAHRAKKSCGIHRKENAQKMNSLDHKNSQHIDAEVLYQHDIYIPIDKNSDLNIFNVLLHHIR